MVVCALFQAGHLEPIAQFLPKHAIIIEVDKDGQIIQSLHGRSKVRMKFDFLIYGSKKRYS